MIDLLGPASTNAVTTRPADPRTIGADDTFWKDCSGPGVQDGTQLRAAFFNNILQQIRRAIRGMGIVADNSDDDMLLKAIKAAASSQIMTAAATQPTHLEILATSGVFSFSTVAGQVVINPAQRFVWRGLMSYSTDQFDAASRTFATLSSKTYHLRWHAAGTGDAVPIETYPRGRFVLKDLADVSYNPTAVGEGNAGFDGSFDNALIARIVTNGGNTLTVTPLSNKAVLAATFEKTTVEWNGNAGPYAGGFLYLPYLTGVYNWARTPKIWSPANMKIWFPSSGSKSIVAFCTDLNSGDIGASYSFAPPSRYHASAAVYGYDTDPAYSYKSGQIKMNAQA